MKRPAAVAFPLEKESVMWVHPAVLSCLSLARLSPSDTCLSEAQTAITGMPLQPGDWVWPRLHWRPYVNAMIYVTIIPGTD